MKGFKVTGVFLTCLDSRLRGNDIAGTYCCRSNNALCLTVIAAVWLREWGVSG